MIRHPTIKAVINQCIGDVDSSSKDLVQMSSILVSDSVWVECSGEVEDVELTIHVVDVVIEVTTHHDRSIRILSHDIFDDIRHPLRSLLLEYLFTWFEVAIQHLHLTVTSRHSHPAEIGAE